LGKHGQALVQIGHWVLGGQALNFHGMTLPFRWDRILNFDMTEMNTRSNQDYSPLDNYLAIIPL
jgi:hypothetical protein